MYCALVGEDIRHGLCLAVNHGGPSGAAGALTGGLLGALHGETALPPAWLAELEGRPTMLVLADDFAMEMTQGPGVARARRVVSRVAGPVSAGVRAEAFFAPSAPTRPVPGGCAPRPPLSAVDGLVAVKRRTG